MIKHTCHWQGCEKECPPKMWGCKEHWYTLPKFLRDKIWSAYQRGQEIRKDPSQSYILIASLAQLWIREYKKGNVMDEKTFCGPFMESIRTAKSIPISAHVKPAGVDGNS